VVIPEIKGEVLLTLAKCCTPIPGDEIIGYISKGRGVVVHRRDCKNLLSILGNVDNSLEKIVKVEWANDVKILYPVKIQYTYQR